MMFLPLLLIGGVVYYMYTQKNGSAIVTKNPETILKERFARGEIDEAMYLRMLETLKH